MVNAAEKVRRRLLRATRALRAATVDHAVAGGNALAAWPHETTHNPEVTNSSDTPDFRVLTLEALAQIKLTAFRDKDRTHLRDLISVNLLDNSWLSKLPYDLAARLLKLLDTPEG